MARIYVIDAGERGGSGFPSSVGSIVVTCLIEFAAEDGSFVGQKAFIDVPISPAGANWKQEFKNAVATWALGEGHTVVKLAMCDYTVD